MSDDEYNYGTSTTSWDARLGLEPFIDLVFWVVFAAVIIGVAVALSRLVARTIVLRKRGLSVTDQIELALKTAWWSMVHPSK